MPNLSKIKIIYRIIDANINRLKEGLRVCEELARFALNSKGLASGIKEIRHGIDAVLKSLPKNIKLLKARESLKDVGRTVYVNELKRKDYQDIFFANMQRAKESIRVLEEFSKLINKNIAVRFKKIRYEIYDFEKKIAGRISSLYRS